jgi:hypothetical protein
MNAEKPRMCPFLAVALGRGVTQMPVDADGKVRPEIVCCRDNCQWWHGGKCAMQAIMDRLDQLGHHFRTPLENGDTA